MTTPSKLYGCWKDKPLVVPWPGAKESCGYDDKGKDERCRGCYEHPAQVKRRADSGKIAALDDILAEVQETWWGRWAPSRNWSPEARAILDDKQAYGGGHPSDHAD